MTLNEIQEKYDWNKYCICSDIDVEVGWQDVKAFAKDIATSYAMQDDIEIEFAVHELKHLGYYMPDIDWILSYIADALDEDTLYSMENKFEKDAKGLEEFKAAYQKFCDAQTYKQADEMVEQFSCSFQDLKDFAEGQ